MTKRVSGPVWTQEEKDYLRDHTTEETKKLAADMTALFGREFRESMIKGARHRYGWPSGRTGRFEKGHKQNTKGQKVVYKSEEARRNSAACQFKKGNVPPNTYPVGRERKLDGYTWVKIADDIGAGWGNWKQKHRLLWEQANGPIPKGMRLKFLDGDRSNVTLENLMLVDDAENVVVKASSDPDITKSEILLYRLDRRCREKSKKTKEG